MTYARRITMQNLIDILSRVEIRAQAELSNGEPIGLGLIASRSIFPADTMTMLPIPGSEPPARCCDCIYWAKNPGTGGLNGLLMCAVNIPTPTAEALERVDGRKAWARHDCSDFDPIARD